VVFLDNLTLSERVEKRDNNNPINSNNPRGDPKWNTDFHKHKNHRIIAAVLHTNPKRAIVIVNIYAPTKVKESKKFYEELGDFNATLSHQDSVHFTNTPNICSPSKNSPFLKKLLREENLISAIPHFIDPSSSRFNP